MKSLRSWSSANVGAPTLVKAPNGELKKALLIISGVTVEFKPNLPVVDVIMLVTR